MRIQKQVLELILSHISLVFLSLVPFLGLFFKVFFRKSAWNYAEYVVVSCYLMAGCSLVSMPFTLLILALGQNPFVPGLTAFLTGLYLAYLAWAFVKFAQPANKWLGVLKVLLAYLMAYLLYILVFSLLVGLGVGLYVWIWGMPQ